MKPSTISLMPEGLLDALNAQQRKDLLTFLLMPPPLEPAPIEREGKPPARKISEVTALLEKSNLPKIDQSNLKPVRIVLCDGPKDHGVNEHDYPVWKQRWSRLLSLAENVSVETADSWPSPDQFKTADVIAYSDNPNWSASAAKCWISFSIVGVACFTSTSPSTATRISKSSPGAPVSPGVEEVRNFVTAQLNFASARPHYRRILHRPISMKAIGNSKAAHRTFKSSPAVLRMANRSR